MAFRVSTELCNHYYHHNAGTLCSTYYPSIPPFSLAPQTTHLLSLYGFAYSGRAL